MNNLKFTSSNVFKTFLIILFLGISNFLFSQTPTVQDCLGAIPICAETYTELNSPTGSGNYSNEISGTSQGGICCMSSESNSIWYTFTVNQSGNFGFTLTPNNLGDDYDWALFNITVGSCADIFSDPSMQVSCNAAGGGTCDGVTGANGGSAYDNQGANCGNLPPNQSQGFSAENALVPVQQGNTYVLLISNWTGSPFGYTIDFSAAINTGIIDNIDPEITDSVTPGDCGGDEFEVTFSENIQCSTIDGSNFSIQTPSGPYTGSITVNSNTCSQGGEYDDAFTITVNPPMDEPGIYTITLVNSQTEVLDLCDNASISGNFSFEVIAPPLTGLDIGNDTIICEGQTLMVDATTNNATIYQWLLGPMTVSNTATYEISQTGLYNVIVTNDCNTLIDQIFVEMVPTPPFVDIDLGPDTILCQGDLYNLDATWTDGSEYIWQDGFDGAVYTVLQSGVYEVNVQGYCGEMGSGSVTIIYEDIPSVELGNDTIICEGEVLNFDVTTPFVNSYEWQDGSTSSTYEISQTGNYNVTLISNCVTISENIFVEVVPSPPFADIDLGPDTILCQGDLYNLDATWTNGSEYTWQDGFDGAVYTVTQPGVYEVNVQGYCGEMGSGSVTIIYEDTPTVELGNDTIICEGEVLNFDVTTPFVNSYEWQDGSIAPTYEISQTGNYNVTLISNCVTISDNIFVEVVPSEDVNVMLGNDTMLCPGELLPLDATWSSAIQYLWQDSSTTPTYTVSESGLYEVQILDACGQMGSAMIEVLYDTTQLRLDLGEDRVLCEEDIPVVLDATDFNAENYLWQDSSQGPFIQIAEAGIYAVTLSDKCNVVTDEVVLDFTNCTICEVYVPNAFSPDFNGYNDFFRPYSNCVLENFSMKIFNRWGAMIFETSDVDTGWDGRFKGKDIAEGVYVYLLEFQVNQMGETLDRQLSGDLTVLK